MFCKKVQLGQGLIWLSLFINAYFLTQKKMVFSEGGGRGRMDAPSLCGEKEGHLKISSVSKLGAGFSPHGDIPLSALVL